MKQLKKKYQSLKDKMIKDGTYNKELDSNYLSSTIYRVCSICGNKGSDTIVNPNKSGTSTYHANMCDVCGKITTVTQPRDFGYPDFNLITL